MNRRDSSTRDYFPNPRPTRTERLRRRRRKQITILAILGILALILILSAVFVLKDAIGGDGEDTPDTSEVLDATTPSPDETTEPDGESDETTVPVTNPPASGYTSIILSSAEAGAGPLVLVNATHPFTFPNGDADIEKLYDANELAQAPDKTMKSLYLLAGSENISLNSTALAHFKDMCRALVTEKGYNVYVDNNGGYRSYATQESLYKTYPQTANPPGQSDHNSGYGINMAVFMNGRVYKFSDSNDACRTILAWVNANAHKYGFVRRFDPTKESQTGMPAGLDDWHYRYVGEAHAYYMTQTNLCLEEYIAVLENYYSYGENHLKFTTDTGKQYEIYFVAQTGSTTAVPVPTGKSYTVSGNNHSGFIVTVEA